MYFTINDKNEINGFYPDDYSPLPTSAKPISDADHVRSLLYQSQGLAMCVTNGIISGESRPFPWSVWSDNGEWVDDAERKAAITAETITAQIAHIDAQLDALDLKCIRPNREINLGIDTDGTAAAKLTECDTKIAALRSQRATLAAKL